MLAFIYFKYNARKQKSFRILHSILADLVIDFFIYTVCHNNINDYLCPGIVL